MSLNLPPPRDEYDPAAERQRNLLLEQNDRSNRKAGQDIETGEEAIIIRSPDGTRWKLQVANNGALSTALA